MTRHEAEEEVGYLKGMFPLLTLEQGEYWIDVFLKYDATDVRKAIVGYAEQQSGSVDRQGFKTMLVAVGRENPEDRLAAEQDAARKRQQQIASDRERSKRTHTDIDLQLAGLTDDDLIELKAVVMDRNPDLASFLKTSDPRKGKILRAMMARHYQNCTSGR